jgi:hypothetical protein
MIQEIRDGTNTTVKFRSFHPDSYLSEERLKNLTIFLHI